MQSQGQGRAPRSSVIRRRAQSVPSFPPLQNSSHRRKCFSSSRKSPRFPSLRQCKLSFRPGCISGYFPRDSVSHGTFSHYPQGTAVAHLRVPCGTTDCSVQSHRPYRRGSARSTVSYPFFPSGIFRFRLSIWRARRDFGSSPLAVPVSQKSPRRNPVPPVSDPLFSEDPYSRPSR